MVGVKPVLRLITIPAGTILKIDAWNFVSYRCSSNASVGLSNELLNEKITDTGCGTFKNSYLHGMDTILLEAIGGSLHVMFIGSYQIHLPSSVPFSFDDSTLTFDNTILTFDIQ